MNNLQATLQSLIGSLEGKTGNMAELSDATKAIFETLLLHLRPRSNSADTERAHAWYAALPAQKVREAALAIQAAGSYTTHPGPNGIAVHNDQIAALLRDRYTPCEFHKLMELCDQHNVFQLEVNPSTGLVRTSTCPENWEMHNRVWVNDTIYIVRLQYRSHPEAAHQALITLARFYCTQAEQEEIARTVADRNYFLDRSGLKPEDWLKRGVAHVFVPGTAADPHAIARDSGWFNHKRLGSHGLALAVFCDLVVHGVQMHRNINTNEVPIVVEAIASLAAYLAALNTIPLTGMPDFSACSAGHWEETPYEGGLTSDIEFMRAGFEALHSLLSDEQLAINPIVPKIRRLLKQHKYGALMQDLPKIEGLISVGSAIVALRLLSEPYPYEHLTRPHDASLIFISTSSICLADDVWDDVSAHFKVLDHVCATLLREHGMIRYAPFDMPLDEGGTFRAADSYLALNFWLPHPLRCWIADVPVDSTTASAGSTDTSTDKSLIARQALMPPGTEAQWFMVSEAAAGYALKTTLQLLMEITSRGTAPNSTEMSLIDHGVSQAHNLINRAFARITHSGKNQIVYKSNGLPCPPWSVPEAFEYVSDGQGGHTLLPGVNTPLAWAQASLFSAAQLFMEMLHFHEYVMATYPPSA